MLEKKTTIYNDFFSQFSKALNWSHFYLFSLSTIHWQFFSARGRGVHLFFKWEEMKLEPVGQESGQGGVCTVIPSSMGTTEKGKGWCECYFIWAFNSSQRFWNPLAIVPPVGFGCESLAKLLLTLERLCCSACTPVKGGMAGWGWGWGWWEGEVHKTPRLSGATDKTEATLDQQPKPGHTRVYTHTHNKPHSSSSSGCWEQQLQMFTERTWESHPGVFRLSAINLTAAAWM